MKRFNPINALFAAIGSLPLSILYPLSSGIAFLAGTVVGYRRKVIRQNLSSSFPEKSPKEIRRIEKEFYGFLCDYFVETLRLGRMSVKEIRSRMLFEGEDEVNRILASGQNVSLYLGHYCNWEWLSSIPLHITARAETGQIYHPLENATADSAFLNIRNHFGATSIKMADTLQTILRWRREGTPSIIGYIADQAPGFNGMHYFADFLHHETGAYTGPERISRMLHAAVFYCDITRTRRGQYLCRYIKMTDDAAKLPQFQLTQQYYDMLEANIKRAPAFWLWSHKRWKRTKKDFFAYHGEEDARNMLSHL